MFHNMMMSSIIKYLKFDMLEVSEFSSDFQSVKHKYNRTDLNIINNHFQIGAS